MADDLIRAGHGRVVELEGRRLFADVFGPPPRLLVYGAVDTADALCAAARGLGWHTIAADARARFATPERLPHADEVIVAWPEETLAQVQPDHATAIVVLTHDDKFDVPMLAGALTTDAFYVGALGSRRNQERRRERLLEAGVDESALERISGLPVETFAYPFGSYGPASVQAARDSGFIAAVSTGGGSWDPFRLTRAMVGNLDPMPLVLLKLDDRYEPLMGSRPINVLRQRSKQIRRWAQKQSDGRGPANTS